MTAGIIWQRSTSTPDNAVGWAMSSWLDAELAVKRLKWCISCGIHSACGKRDIGYYLMSYYNWRRPHQHNDGMPPAEAEDQLNRVPGLADFYTPYSRSRRRCCPNPSNPDGTSDATRDLITQIPFRVSFMGNSLHPVVNWSQYNQSLINRGSLTFWVDTDAINNWFHQEHHGRPGRSPRFTDQTICTFLMLKGIFSLSLRATQGLLDSLFTL